MHSCHFLPFVIYVLILICYVLSLFYFKMDASFFSLQEEYKISSQAFQGNYFFACFFVPCAFYI